MDMDTLTGTDIRKMKKEIGGKFLKDNLIKTQIVRGDTYFSETVTEIGEAISKKHINKLFRYI